MCAFGCVCVCVCVLSGHTDKVRAVAVLSPALVATASNDGSVRVWRVSDGECVATGRGHSDAIWAIATLAQSNTVTGGYLLATTSADKTIRVWGVTEEGAASAEL